MDFSVTWGRHLRLPQMKMKVSCMLPNPKQIQQYTLIQDFIVYYIELCRGELDASSQILSKFSSTLVF